MVCITGPAVHSMTNGTASTADRHPPTANDTATNPSKQKAPQQPGPQPDEPKPQKQTPAASQPTPSAKSTDSKAAKIPLQAHANGGPPEPAPAAAEVPPTAEWTDESQQMLVRALKEIGKEIPDRSVLLLGHYSYHICATAACLCNFTRLMLRSCYFGLTATTIREPCISLPQQYLLLCCIIMPGNVQQAVILAAGGKEWPHWCQARLGRSARSDSGS